MREAIGHAVRAAIEAHRQALVRRFGWTDLDVDATVQADTQTVVLRGRVLAPRFAVKIAAIVAEVVPASWRVDARGLQPEPAGPWHALVNPVTRLRAAIPGPDRVGGLATELLAEDGPVMCIADHAGWTLARATDGTLGWTNDALGPVVDPPRHPGRGSGTAAAFVDAAKTKLGTPYRLGGTTDAGIDCSGLVQRALRIARIGIVPRHSSDQLSIDPRAGAGSDCAGDLVFVWSTSEAPCHVGIADGRGAIVHASRSRGTVSDPRTRFVQDAKLVCHVPFAAIVALQDRLEGAASLADAFELGRGFAPP